MWRTLTAVCALAAALLTGASRAAGQVPVPVFAFGEPALAASCADLVKGVQLAISNTTAVAQPLHLRLDPAGGGVPIAGACGGLAFASPPRTLGAGETITVTLDAASAAPVSAPESGTAVAYAAVGLVTSLPLTIVPSSAEGIPTPLVSSVSATEYEHRSGAPIWVPVQLGSATEVALTPGEVVGAVASSSGRAPVTYASTRKLGGIDAVGLEVSGLGAGSYSGTVDLAPAVPGKGAVAVTLVVKQWWPIAVGILLLSILIAFAVQRLAGVVVPRRRLSSEAGSVAITYEEKRQALRDGPGDGAWKQSELSDVTARIEELESEISTRTAGAYVSLASSVVASIEADIAALAGGVDLSRLSAPAADLEAALAGFTAHPPDALPELVDLDLAEPALVTAARGQLAVHAIRTAGLAALVGTIGSAAADVNKLAQRRRYVASLHQDALELRNLHRGDAAGLQAIEEQLAALAGVWRQLSTTDESGRLDELLPSLRAIDNALSLLWPQAAPGRIPARVGLLGMAASELEQLDLATAAFATAAAPAASAPSPLSAEIAVARRDAAVATWLQAFVVLVGLVLAVVAGLAVLYVGKPFGTAWDDLAIVTWGLATPTALAAAGTALDNLGALTALERKLGR